MHQYYLDVWVSNPEPAASSVVARGSSEVQVHTALYLGHYATESDEWTFFLHDLKYIKW